MNHSCVISTEHLEENASGEIPVKQTLSLVKEISPLRFRSESSGRNDIESHYFFIASLRIDRRLFLRQQKAFHELVELAVQDCFHVAHLEVGSVIFYELVRLHDVRADLASPRNIGFGGF